MQLDKYVTVVNMLQFVMWSACSRCVKCRVVLLTDHNLLSDRVKTRKGNQIRLGRKGIRALYRCRSVLLSSLPQLFTSLPAKMTDQSLFPVAGKKYIKRKGDYVWCNRLRHSRKDGKAKVAQSSYGLPTLLSTTTDYAIASSTARSESVFCRGKERKGSREWR